MTCTQLELKRFEENVNARFEASKLLASIIKLN